MRVFLAGATGFIGSHLIAELIGAGHQVVGLSRSDAGTAKLTETGADVVRGDLDDLEGLRAASAAADGVIHAAFNHDFANVKQHSEADRRVIATLGEALAGSDRPFIVTSGTGLVQSRTGDPVTEADEPASSTDVPRAATEEAARALVAKGGRVIVMRLPQVHDSAHQGRIALHILLARRHGRVAYIGEGENRLPAAHVSDVVRLYRLALEQGQAGARYHAVDEQGVSLRAIAEVIGAGLKLPVASIAPDQADAYFGGLAGLAAMDLAASGAATRAALGWAPKGPDLLSDLGAMDYSVG